MLFLDTEFSLHVTEKLIICNKLTAHAGKVLEARLRAGNPGNLSHSTAPKKVLKIHREIINIEDNRGLAGRLPYVTNTGFFHEF
jgi:hypothetical protein